MIELVRVALEEAGAAPHAVAGIGVASPGPLDLDQGLILETPNLGWSNVAIRSTFSQAFDCPAWLLNDVDAGVYGEYRFGVGRRARCLVGVFPGTGIGGGCVYDGTIVRGSRHSCMEVGHAPVMPQGALCGCGRRGCLETVAGRQALAAAALSAAMRGQAPYLSRQVGTDLGRVRSKVLAAAVNAGDQVVEQILREGARWIGYATAGVINLLTPDVVLLGGGLVEAMPALFLEEVEAAARARVMDSFRDTFKVVAAELGDDAGVTGAAAWAEHMSDREKQA
jgi:glucokinase